MESLKNTRGAEISKNCTRLVRKVNNIRIRFLTQKPQERVAKTQVQDHILSPSVVLIVLSVNQHRLNKRAAIPGSSLDTIPGVSALPYHNKTTKLEFV